MAFCPQCGTSVTEQASQCVACGEALGTKAKGLRFKGTMMAVGGQLPSAISPNAQAGAAKVPVTPVTTAAAAGRPDTTRNAPSATGGAQPRPAQAAAPPSRINKGTMMGVGTSASEAHPSASAEAPAAAVKASLAKSPIPAPLGAATQPKKPGASPAPAARSGAAGASLPPKKVAVSVAPIARTDGAANARLGTANPATSASAPRKPEGRFRAGSVPPALPPQDRGRLFAISLGGIVLIAAAGYAVAQYLGLLH